MDNYKQENGTCISISTLCSTMLSNCAACGYVNSQIVCKNCEYPYYLNENTCVKGSSILCQNGAIGPYPYQCSLDQNCV